MRYAVIMAGGSGTRLWPMSRADQPKQLIPFINGKSLLAIADQRLEGLVDADRRTICAGEAHQQVILDALPQISGKNYLAEPTGRNTLNAVGYVAAVLHKRDPDAVIAVFTADHLIEPVDKFQQIVTKGFELVEDQPNTLVTFGITPTHAATGYGYLQLGDAIDGDARVVSEFKEKPEQPIAEQYYQAGGQKYLWNSGMFVWKAATLLDCIERYHPENFAGLMKIANAWDTPLQKDVLDEVYPTLKKISVDFAVMEPASQDDKVQVAAIPMPLTWLDVGSWPSFAQTCDEDDCGNAVGQGRHLLMDTKNTLAASSDPNHLIATIGCEDMIIIHTEHATLVCPRDRAQQIKELHKAVGERFGDELL